MSGWISQPTMRRFAKAALSGGAALPFLAWVSITLAPPIPLTRLSVVAEAVAAEGVAEEGVAEEAVAEKVIAEEEDPRADAESVNMARFQPAWKIGQTWIVETVTRQSQAGRPPAKPIPARPVRWRFEVLRREKYEGQSCFVVEIRCLQPGRQPVTTIWVDSRAMTLRGVRAQLPVGGGWTSVRESYRSASGQPFPAFGPHSLPPLELPVFLSGTKGQATFHYEASARPAGTKALGEIGFARAVDQTVQRADSRDFSPGLPEHFAKTLEARPTIQVRLKSGANQIKQFWQAGLPWPAFTDNGRVQSSLVVLEPGPGEVRSERREEVNR